MREGVRRRQKHGTPVLIWRQIARCGREHSVMKKGQRGELLMRIKRSIKEHGNLMPEAYNMLKSLPESVLRHSLLTGTFPTIFLLCS